MKLLAIDIHAFGQINHKTIHFDEGLNIIYGLNEQGKSTIHKFIEVMFYGFYKAYTKNRQYEDAYQHYRPWHHSGYGGTLTFEDQGQVIRLERQLIKGQESLEIYDVATGELITKTYDYNKVIRQVEPGLKHFGHNKITYRNTVSMTQISAKTEQLMITEIKDHMTNMTASQHGSISIDQVIGKIEGIENTIGSTRKKTSPYNVLFEEIKALKNDLIEAKKVVNELQKDKDIEQGMKQRIEVLLAKKRTILEDLRYLEFIKKKEVLHEREKLELEIDHLEGELKIHKPYESFTLEEADHLRHQLAEINSGNQKLKSLQRDKLTLEDEIEKLSQEADNQGDIKLLAKTYEALNKGVYDHKDLIDHLKNRQDEKSMVLRQKATIIPVEQRNNRVILAGLVAIIGLSITYWFGLGVFLIGGISLLAIIAVSLVMLGDYRHRQSYQYYCRDITNLDQSLNFIDREISDLQMKIDLLLDGFDGVEPYELVMKRDQALATLTIAQEKGGIALVQKSEIDDLAKSLDSNEEAAQKLGIDLGDLQLKWQLAMARWGFDSEEDIQKGLKAYMAYSNGLTKLQQLNQRKALLQKSKVLDATSDDVVMEGRNYPQEDERGLKNQLESIELELTSLRDALGLKTGRRLTLMETSRPLVEVQEEIAVKERILAGYDHDLAVASLMKSTVTRIAIDIQNNFAPALNATMSEVVSRITGGRYSDIKVNPELELTIFDRLASKTISVEQLSAGTIDSIYFGLRLGISTVLTQGRQLPLILDDVFIQYDDERMRQAMKLLYQDQRQVLLFTCHKREIKCLEKDHYSFNTIVL